MERPRSKQAELLSGRELLRSAALGAGGVLLAFAALYAATGVHDGFGDWDLHRMGRHLRRMMVWLVPAAAIAGPFILDSYHRMLVKRARRWEDLHAIARPILHFGLWAMSILLAVMLQLFLFAVNRIAARVGLKAGLAEPFSPSWLATPIWFFGFPFAFRGVDMTNEDGKRLKLPFAGLLSPRRFLRWLPWLMAGIWFWTGAVSEDTGERVDSRWLFVAASYWFADFLIVALQVVPALKARHAGSQGA